jgi:hypothetical protein
MTHSDHYVQIAGGHHVYFGAPHLTTFTARGLAQQLSQINRYNGCAGTAINVASHSLDVARLLKLWRAPAATQLLGLLHDAHEAVIGDITKPLRQALKADGCTLIERLSDRIDVAVRASFNLERFATVPALADVARADNSVFAAEWRDWMQGPSPVPDLTPAPFRIRPLPQARAEQVFLTSFEKLVVEACAGVPTGLIK